MVIKHKLAKALEQAVKEAQQEGQLAVTTLPGIMVERTQNPEHGDYASSVPLKLAKAASIAPSAIAEKVLEFMPPLPEVSRIVVAAPGFINFKLSADWLTEQVAAILDAGDSYGNIDLGAAKSVQIEFVSVNPTGPLHVGHGRGAVLGSTLANVLGATGYTVEKEYYINDAGSQLDAFSRSLYARYQQCLGVDAEMPSDGYMGSYMVELASEIINKEGKRFLRMSGDIAVRELGAIGVARIMDMIRQDIEMLRVEFDVWFSEQSLYKKNGQYEKVMKLLREDGYVAKKENATWFISSALGEDKDNVLIRSDGSPTYFASDIAYHFNKFLERKFDTVINIWGADHQGHVSRMVAVVNALGINRERLRIIICQLVTLRRGQEIVRVSKRSGDMVTLREVMDEVGSDACRFVFLSRSADAQMDFDLELAKKQSADNPVYYVQYAHARISSILRLAEEKGIDYSRGDVSLLTTEPELTLIRRMILLPEILELIASTLEPHHLPYYAQDLATVFHSFYKQCRVVSKNKELTWARLKLVKAAQIVLARTLHLMGMTAPESM
ncbi:MAG: arginine--tRNA ligase [Chloroflexi bacterium RBG_13_50_10]|nr:MAG: arginine--tRNA ligase [Chloroflexi bacterium RBG_13_50_10]